MSTLNGSTGTVYTAIAGAAAVGSILFAQAYRALDALEDRMVEDRRELARQLDEAKSDAKAAREEIRREMAAQFAIVNQTFAVRGGMIEANKADIQVIRTQLAEIETQFGATNTIANAERQYLQSLLDLLQQCPSCRVPEREYYPPRPGPGEASKDQH